MGLPLEPRHPCRKLSKSGKAICTWTDAQAEKGCRPEPKEDGSGCPILSSRFGDDGAADQGFNAPNSAFPVEYEHANSLGAALQFRGRQAAHADAVQMIEGACRSWASRCGQVHGERQRPFCSSREAST
jgi:hypothetical protein